MSKEVKTIKVDLEPSELYQIILSVACRTSFCSQKWACATSKEEELQAQNYMNYLTALSAKLQKILSDNTPKEKTENGK